MSSVKISDIGDQVKLFTLDMPGKSANVLTDQVYADLDQALSEIEQEPPRGIVLATAKPSIFVAGADLEKIAANLDWPDESIFEFCDHGRSIMSRFSELEECVSVAAIHGVCVGGGLELTLWCDKRIASDNRRTLLGLPEVKLGLIPGWAGTVRLPRLIGFEPAADLTMTGDLVSAAESMELGITSLVVPEEVLIASALQVIDREHYTGGYLKQREELKAHVKRKKPKSVKQFRNASMESVRANRDLGTFAPETVMEHMLDTARVSADEACASESRAFAKVWGSEENRGLLHYFFVDERSRKTRPSFAGEPPEIRQVSLIGAGLMGSQIARLCARAGYNLAIYDADGEKSQNLVAQILDSPDCKSEQVEAIADLAELGGSDMVVECIVEKLKIKQDLFERICKVVGPDVFLATNTSTIPVSDIAEAVANPGRLVGLHFCCPVEPLQLVEVIDSDATSALTTNVALELTRKLRKTPVVVKDRPGFVVNRLLCPVFDKAMILLQQGVSLQQIDRVFRDFGFEVGPLEMIDFIGVDTIMYAGETFLRTLPDLISLTPVLPALVKRGRLGRKAGVGFYRYETFGSEPAFDPEFESIIQKYQKQPVELDDAELLSQLLDPMAEQAQQVLAEGIVADVRDVDLCSVLGTTFPKVRGGILHWASRCQTTQS